MPVGMLLPVIVLALWTHLMWLWMYVTRIPAIRAAQMKLDPHVPRGDQMATLPSHVRWKADNYNHLMEQPTVFYAVAITYSLLMVGGGWPLWFAWAYVGIRIIHSLVQATWNKIEVRFSLFVLSTLVLIALTIRALILIVTIMKAAG